MIKKIRVTVDGKPYEVTVEIPDESAKTPSAVPPVFGKAEPIMAASVPTPPPVAPAGGNSIVSPLAGRVTAIGVKVGQDVKDGEHVLTLEAMKMNTFVFAQKGGQVKEICVAVSDAVHEGQPLILLG